MSIDIVPDIHGHADKLDALLAHLGWRHTPSGWLGPDPDRRLVFLGDFIDRGPENARVIRTVRSLMDAGKADAVMGNHELNAILYHTAVERLDGGTRRSSWLRAHSAKNTEQHAAFLREFPLGQPATREVIDWMKSLPIFHQGDGFRAVHACWYAPDLELIAQELPDRRLDHAVLTAPGFLESDLFGAIDTATKGPEEELPDGLSFLDKGGHERHHARIGWWRREARTWAELAITGNDSTALPETEAPERARRYLYEDAIPVFFGHYWLTGAFRLEAPRALCLDYSAGKGGPLACYRFDGDPALQPGRIVTAP